VPGHTLAPVVVKVGVVFTATIADDVPMQP
jgi:hypothetical protein